LPIIEAKGLFGGKRLRKCSDGARLRWPHYFLASNGFARFKLDPEDMLARAFPEMRTAVSIDTFWSDMSEYRDNFLLFVWEAGGVWGQWDCPERCLNKYKTRGDKESPTPDAGAFEAWRLDYQRLGEIPESFRKFPKISPNSPLGIGVVVVVESSGAEGSVVEKTAPPPPKELTLEDWNKPDLSEVAKRLANDLVRDHWCISDLGLVEANLWTILAGATDLSSAASGILDRHVRWRTAVEESKRLAKLPAPIARKACQYWLKDGWHSRDPDFATVVTARPLSTAEARFERLKAEAEKEKHGPTA